MLNNPRLLKLLAITAVIAVVGVALFLRLSSLEDVNRAGAETRRSEDPLAKARALLRRSSDSGSCRAALSQVNTKLNQDRDTEVPTLSAAAREELRQRVRLADDELAEIERPTFTLLDGMHLERALFFHEAAVSVTPQLEAPAVRTPEQQAQTLFAWVVRQVQLNEVQDMDGDRPMVAPALALRRGVGSPLVRALVFLGLLEQVGLDGCLLAYPSRTGATWNYWACGVLGSGNKIYLFEPRLGLPLPGADGTGIATLDALRTGTDAILHQLDFGSGQRLDLTAEMVAASEVHLAVPLSALAPRLGYIEKEVLARVTPARLTADPEAAERFTAALRAIKHPEVVKLAPWAARLERNFLPEDEGGVDRQRLYQHFRAEINGLVSLRQGITPDGRRFEAVVVNQRAPLVANLPAKFRPQQPEQLNDPPLNGLFREYSSRLSRFYLAPGQPRDQILRGDFAEATRALSPAAEQNLLMYSRFSSNFAPEQVLEWLEEVRTALARDMPLPKAGPGLGMVNLLVEGTAAEAILPELRYLAALVKHEQAERTLYRLGPPSSLKDPAQLKELFLTWRDAKTLWEGFFSQVDPRPSEGLALQAKALQARCQHLFAEAALAQARQAAPSDRVNLEEQARTAVDTALRFWQDLAANRKDLAGVGYRFQARSLEKKAEQKR